MESPDINPNDWVAYKKDLFTQSEDNEKIRFICGWNSEKEKIAIIYHEGQRKASDYENKNKATLLSIEELVYYNKELCCINNHIKRYFPLHINQNFITTMFAIKPKINNKILKQIEEYLFQAVKCLGKRNVLSLIFSEDDPLDEYEENINELRTKSFEDAVDRAYEELEEILHLRNRAESLLQLKAVYVVETEAVKKIFVALSELYSFLLKPFTEVREMACSKLNAAKERLKDEIGPNIKTQVSSEIEEWNEQYLIAAEAIEQLYQDYYRKTLALAKGQRDRVKDDESRFGKTAFSLHALPHLQNLNIQFYEEKLKLYQTIKSMKEVQRDKVKQQFSHISHGPSSLTESNRIQQEVYDAQHSVFDSQMEVLDVQERLLKTKLAIFNKEYEDKHDVGVFFEAVEHSEALDDVPDSSSENQIVEKFKKKLNNIYRKRAAIRNQKKTLTEEQKKRKESLIAVKEKTEKAATIKRPEKKTVIRELSPKRVKEERKKTLQRLRKYKKKAETINKGDRKFVDHDSDEEYHSLPMDQSSSSFDLPHSTNIPVPSSGTGAPPVNLPPPPPPPLNLPPPPLPPLNLPPPPPPPNLPPPPPPPPLNLPPPPPPPPPPIPIPSGSSSLADQIAASKLKSAGKEQKSASSTKQFDLDEILKIRSKLKKPDEMERSRSQSENQRGEADFQKVLLKTLDRIRNVTVDSDSEPDSDHGDFC